MPNSSFDRPWLLERGLGLRKDLNKMFVCLSPLDFLGNIKLKNLSLALLKMAKLLIESSNESYMSITGHDYITTHNWP